MSRPLPEHGDLSPARHTPQRVRLRFRFAASLISLALLPWMSGPASSRPSPTRPGAPFAVGFVLTHVKARCIGQDGPAHKDLGVRPEDYVVAHYDDPEVRSSVRAALDQMHGQGASIMRTNLWFRHAEDIQMARAPDPLGMLVASDGRLPAAKLANLVRLASDARSSGYTLFGVAIGPQGRSNPKCREGGVFGACYDPGLLERSWSVVDQTAAALLPLRTPGFQVVLDISPENCPDGEAGPLVERNEEAFTKAIVGRFARKYGTGFFASCGGAPPSRGARGLQALARIYREMNVRPALIDVHLYERNSNAVDAELINADRVAGGFGVPLYVMETYADDSVLFAEAERLKRARQAANLAGVMIWPLDAGAACQISISPPYDFRRILSVGNPPAG